MMQSVAIQLGSLNPFRPAPVAAADFASKRPDEVNTSPVVYRATDAKFWHEAKALCPAAGTPFTRNQLAQPKVAAHFGQALAQCHNQALHQCPPTSGLKTVIEAAPRLNEASSSALFATREELKIPGLDALRIELSDRLTSLAPRRVYTAYNWYPSTITCDDSGTITSTPDHTATGYHAWFEPLCRLDYMSRGTARSLSASVTAYLDSSLDRDINATGKDTAFMCRQLFNILYFHYFLAAAMQAPTSGSEKDIETKQAIASASELRDRILVDNRLLIMMGLPKLPDSI